MNKYSAFVDLLFNLYILILRGKITSLLWVFNEFVFRTRCNQGTWLGIPWLSRCIIGNVRVANFAGAKNTNIVGYTKDFVIYKDAKGARAD